jgi:hypothetical protein
LTEDGQDFDPPGGVTPACALGPKRPRCDSIWSHLAYISYLMSCFALLIFPLILPFSYRNCFVYKHCTGSRIQGASTELCSDTTDFPPHLAAGNLPPLTFPIHALGHTNSHALTSAYNGHSYRRLLELLLGTNVLEPRRLWCVPVASWTETDATQTFGASLVLHYVGQWGLRCRIEFSQKSCSARAFLFLWPWRRLGVRVLEAHE